MVPPLLDRSCLDFGEYIVDELAVAIHLSSMDWESGVDQMARVASALPVHQGLSPPGRPWCLVCFFYKTKSTWASAC
jgi:hypothetical protein